MNLTLLEKNQIFGSRGLFIKKPLSIFEKYGTKAAITDFPILLGGYVSYLTLNNSDELKDRTGQYWTKTDDKDNDAYIVRVEMVFKYGLVFPNVMVDVAQLYHSHQS